MEKEMNLFINISSMSKDLEYMREYYKEDRRKKEIFDAAIEECEYIQVGLATLLKPSNEISFDLQMSKDDFLAYSENICNELKEDLKELKITLQK